MHRTIICGSPRPEGASAHLSQMIFDSCIEECPDDGVSILSVATEPICGCIGCDACKDALDENSDKLPDIPEKGDPLAATKLAYKSNARFHRCIIKDEMDEYRKHLDCADELIVICPVYFAGTPSQMKAFMDRLQPYYWSNIWKMTKERRHLTLHVVGSGDDPHGCAPLITTIKSTFAVAGFKLDRVLDWRGKIAADGEIIADAEEIDVSSK